MAVRLRSKQARAYFELKYVGAALAPAPPAAMAPPAAQPEEDHIYLKVEYQLVRVALADILYVESFKDYVKGHLASQTQPLLSLMSLESLEEKLPTAQFLCIHRFYIVGLMHFRSVGRGAVQIQGEALAVSDGYREAFDQFFSRWK